MLSAECEDRTRQFFCKAVNIPFTVDQLHALRQQAYWFVLVNVTAEPLAQHIKQFPFSAQFQQCGYRHRQRRSASTESIVPNSSARSSDNGIMRRVPEASRDFSNDLHHADFPADNISDVAVLSSATVRFLFPRVSVETAEAPAIIPSSITFTSYC